MVKRIMMELAQNQTALVSESYFRITLEGHLLPLVSKNETNGFDKTHDLIDSLEPFQNDLPKLQEKLETIISSLKS